MKLYEKINKKYDNFLDVREICANNSGKSTVRQMCEVPKNMQKRTLFKHYNFITIVMEQIFNAPLLETRLFYIKNIIINVLRLGINIFNST